MAPKAGALIARLLCGVTLTSVGLFTRPDIASGQTPDTLALADAIAEARLANPRLHAARYRALAALERIGPAGALPDPNLAFGFVNRPVTDPSRTDVQMTMNTVQLAQRFPWPGILSQRKARATHLASADELQADEFEATLVSRVTSLYLRLAYLDRAQEILGETRNLLRDFRRVGEAMYALGTVAQQDVLQAQVAVAQATADLVVLSQDRIAAAARLSSLLGRSAAQLIGPVFLNLDADVPPGVDELIEQASANRPALQAARQRALAAEAGFREAQRAVYPDITVTLAYGNRPEFVDLATLMVGVSLPIFAGSKQKRRREEMRVVWSMEEERELDLYNETYARLGELRARVERARNLSDLYRTSILPQAEASVESALSAYQVGEVDYMTLLTNQMTVNRFRIERIRLAAEYGEAMAEIAALTGANGPVNAPAKNGGGR